MRRIAIIDHNEHVLMVEDIPEDILEKEYGGDEQRYIDDNYDLENYSWDYITDALYLPEVDDGDFLYVNFNRCT